MNRAMVFNFVGYAGLDVLLSLLPKIWQTKRVARAWLRSLTPPHGEQPNLESTPLILQMPWGAFRILDYSGNVKPCSRENIPI